MAGTELERGDLLIQNARLIDGTGALPKTGVSILISDGRIAAIGRKVGGHNVEKLDAQGLTVLPGPDRRPRTPLLGTRRLLSRRFPGGHSPTPTHPFAGVSRLRRNNLARRRDAIGR